MMHNSSEENNKMHTYSEKTEENYLHQYIKTYYIISPEVAYT